jgi:hypothetical protein
MSEAIIDLARTDLQEELQDAFAAVEKAKTEEFWE